MGGAVLLVVVLLTVYFLYRQQKVQDSPLLDGYYELRQAGQDDLAVELLCGMVCADPDVFVYPIDQLLAEQLDNPRHRASLIRAYEAVLAPFPTSPGMTYAVAYLYHLDGRDAEADYLIDHSLASPVENDRWRAHVRTHPEDVSWHTEFYENLHRQMPDDLDTRYKLAYVYQYAGRYAEAASLINAPVEVVTEYDPWRIRLMQLKDQLKLN
jgi:hypothetical protein